jgi:NDP-sugar pyrophosphorylase family protein
MKAMLLAAGIGERMLPLTKLLPKPAIPVLGRPLAVLVLHRLALEGISSAVVNLHHQPNALKALLGDGKDAGLPRIFYSHEESIQGTGGGVRQAAEHLRGDETILVRNSDFLADIDLRAVTAAHLAGGCTITVVLAPHRAGYTPVDVDEKGRVLSFGGRPPVDPGQVAGRYLFTGFQLIEPEVLDWIPADRPSDLVRDLYIRLAGLGQICAYIHDRFWWEFGSPADYLEGSLALLGMSDQDRVRIGKTDPVERIGDARVALGAGADFHSGVELRGRVALGLASLVAEGSRVEDSVVMPEAWVGPGVEMIRAIVAPGAEIPAGMRIENALVCPDPDPGAPLPPDTERVGGLLLRRLMERAVPRRARS